MCVCVRERERVFAYACVYIVGVYMCVNTYRSFFFAQGWIVDEKAD